MNHKTDMQADLKRIASELRAYNPAADEYKGEHIHKVWAREIEAALSGQSAGVPTGYALVPIEPTVEMIAALGFAGDADIAIGHARAFKETVDAYASMIAAAPAPVSEPEQAFQARVKPWMLECFGSEIAADTVERNHRFFEEAGELVQACGMTASEAHQLVDYTWGRPIGEKSQEVGGVMVTLAALCLANGLDMHASGETELERISRPDMVIRIRAKQAAKPKHSPLPVAASAQPSVRGEQDCPHGVDDGACKQCYGEAVSGGQGAAFEEIRDALHETYGFASTSPRGQENINFALGKLDEIEQDYRPPAASAPTLGEPQWPSDRDAAIQACALMILGICKTEPQEVWPKRIEGRIRYMLSKLQPQAAEPKGR